MSGSFTFRGRQVLMLSSIDWDAAWQRHQAWALGLEREGAEVFFVENAGFRAVRLYDLGRVMRRLRRVSLPLQPRGRCRIVSPLTLPPTAALYRRLNARFLVPRLMKRLKQMGLKADPIVFAYLPTATTLAILDHLTPELVVYDCVDNFYGHPSPPHDLHATEDNLLARAGLVLTTSRFLYEEKSKRHTRVLELHHGVAENFFLEPGSPRAIYRKLAYFGTIWDALDFAALQNLAEAGFEVTLIGPIKEGLPPLPASLRRLPPLAHQDLPQALSSFDALLLPYADTEYNRGVVPAKLYECLATGKPVLASSLPGLKSLADVLYLAGSPEEFVQAARALPRMESAEKIARRVAVAREHSTSGQMRALAQAVGEALNSARP